MIHYIKKFSLFFIILAFSVFSSEAQTQTVKILYTSDEHGWFFPSEYNSGASGLYAQWQQLEDFSHDNYLILSGGDNWSGTALSTWSQGKPMSQIMRLMGYRASATGNHEFDFGTDTLAARLSDTGFPFLAANIVQKSDGSVPDFIKPYIITDYKDLKIGLLGLANIETPTTTMPENVEELEFISYADAVNKYAPIIRKEGADFTIILAHICTHEARELAPIAKQYHIPLITAGHCHAESISMTDGVLISETGSYMSFYTFIELEYDHTRRLATPTAFRRIENSSIEREKQTDSIIQIWDAKADKSLRSPMGYTSEKIPVASPQMENLVCDSWLATIPDADLSFSNTGGIRQDIFTGLITQETLMGLLPFNNKLIKLQLTGKQIIDFVKSDNQICIGGFSLAGEARLLDGTAIDKHKTYTALTTDYLYTIKEELRQYDPNPVFTDYSYRSAAEAYIKKLNTSENDPLGNYLDYKQRLPKK